MMGKPSNYPLRSLESRTAARAMADRIKAEREKSAIIVSVEFIGQAMKNHVFKAYPTDQRGKR
jgi:hypothetical protein